MLLNEMKHVNLVNAFADIEAIKLLDGVALQNYLLYHFNALAAQHMISEYKHVIVAYF